MQNSHQPECLLGEENHGPSWALECEASCDSLGQEDVKWQARQFQYIKEKKEFLKKDSWENPNFKEISTWEKSDRIYFGKVKNESSLSEALQMIKTIFFLIMWSWFSTFSVLNMH